MANISAATFAAQAQQFLGRKYSEMDCRELINRMLRACGVNASYNGSNALWRDMAWTGTPEEAVKQFGSVPVGALLYILDFDGGEVLRGYNDGLGNASHVGVKTGTGQGAVHSSATRECVCESAFRDKTIPNGGWNRVGLLKQVDYGDVSIPASSGQTSSNQPDKQPEVTASSTAVTVAPSGSTVNLRKSASKSAALVDRIPLGQTVTLRGPEKDGWYPVRWGKKEGYIMAEYLKVDAVQPTVPETGSNTPAPEPGGESYSAYAAIFYDLSYEQAVALQADYPMYKSRIEGRNG